MFKKSLILSSLALAVSQLASASTFLTVVRCDAMDAGPDHGINVTVSEFLGPPIFGHPHNPPLSATIAEETIAGQRVLGSYANVERIQPDVTRPGAPEVFKAEGFDLELVVDALPTDGKTPAHLTAEVQGRRVSEELLCTVVR